MSTKKEVEEQFKQIFKELNLAKRITEAVKPKENPDKKITFPYKHLKGDELDIKIAEELYIIASDINAILVMHGRFMTTFDATTERAFSTLKKVADEIDKEYQRRSKILERKGVWGD